jgi:hypothetical protein
LDPKPPARIEAALGEVGRMLPVNSHKQLAEFGLVILSHLFGQKFLGRRSVLLRLYFVPLRQSRDSAAREMAYQAADGYQDRPSSIEPTHVGEWRQELGGES